MAWLHDLDPFAVQFTGSFGLRWYGLAYLAGFYLGYLLIRWFGRRGLSPVPPALAGDFVFTVALGTIVGGRLGYCLFYSPDLFLSFRSDFPFWGVLRINEGGMASHGGILGIVVTCLYYGRRHGLPAFHLFDLTTLGGALGIFFGRIANFVNGELVGRAAPAHLPWAVKFPQDILAWPAHEPARLSELTPAVEALGISGSTWMTWIQSAPGRVHEVLSSLIVAVQSGNEGVAAALKPVLTARHPSQLYEGLLEGAFLFVALMVIWRRPQKPGVIAGWFFVLYATVRIIGEQFRLPDLQIGYQLLGLTRGQWLSIIMLVLGTVFLVTTRRRTTPPLGGWAARSEGEKL